MRHVYEQLSQRVPVLGRAATRQFIKFAMVGVTNTVLDFLLYVFLTRVAGIHFLVANAIAFIIAASWSYTLNKRWTFRDTNTRTVAQFFRFMGVSVVGLGLNEGVLALVVYLIGFHDLVAKLIAIFVVVFWNFLANRAWTFTEHYGRVARSD